MIGDLVAQIEIYYREDLKDIDLALAYRKPKVDRFPVTQGFNTLNPQCLYQYPILVLKWENGRELLIPYDRILKVDFLPEERSDDDGGV